MELDKTDLKSSIIEKVPDILECTGLIVRENNKLKIDIPVLNSEIYNQYDKIRLKTARKYAAVIEDAYCAHLEKVKIQIPSHIKSVLKSHLYYPGTQCIVMSIVTHAFEQKVHLHDVDYCCAPVLLVVDEE